MATAFENGKISGSIGIIAVIVYVVGMLAAIFTMDNFDFGSNTLGDLSSDTIYMACCVVAGILGVVFGLLITVRTKDSEVFVGKMKGLLLVIAGIFLAAIGITEGETWAIYVFIIAIALAALMDAGYDWVVDQKLQMVISLFLAIVMILTGILSQTGDNSITGFLFAIFAAIWVLFIAAMRFAPVVESTSDRKAEKKKAEEKAKAKNAPAPRPYPSKKAEPAAQKKAEAKPAPKQEPKKQPELPKKQPEQPKKEVPPAAAPVEKKEESKQKTEESLPKLKIMSSKEAAAARDSARRRDEPVPVAKEEPAVQVTTKEVTVEETDDSVTVRETTIQDTISREDDAIVVEEEVTVEETTVQEIEVEADIEAEVESTEEETAEDTEDISEFDEALDMTEETPDALLRRATWNKGLRCRRDYGEHQIPIAFVKAKVAVYVVTDVGDTSEDEKLKEEGWTVLRYKESDITDGKEQAEEINKAVKESLKAQRASKKKAHKK